MVPLYLFSLVLGGGFLALSVFGDFLGGHGDVDLGGDLGGDIGGFDGDLGGGLDLDAGGVDVGGVDFDAGGLEMDGAHMEVDVAHADLQADAGHLAAKVFSVRTLFYSLFGFGAVGTLLTFVWSGNPLLTAGFSVASGLASGSIVNLVFGYVKRSESGMLENESGYSGLSGRVILPIRGGIPGKIVLERGGRRVELRALPHASGEDQGDPTTWKTVLVVEMERGVARVVPAEADLLPGP